MTLPFVQSVAIAAIVSGVGGAWLGYRYADGQCAAERLRTATEQARTVAMWRDRHYEMSSAFEALRVEKDKRKVEVHREVERIVERPVYLRECIDADGLRILNAARGVPATPGEPGASVPGSAGGDGSDRGGAAAADDRRR